MIQLIGKKIGMTQVFTENGQMVPVTLVEIKGNRVLEIRSQEKNGYQSVQVGYGINKKEKRKSLVKVYGKEKVPRLIKEFRITQESTVKVGDELTVEAFEGVKYVDVQGRSIGKGFQGVVKRHNMAGGPATHGSHFHRRPGSIGNCSYPARVFKGKKLPGLMGNQNVTIQNIEVVKIDKENNLLLLKGGVAGARKGILYINKAVKKS